jgi:hypothetical protein
MTKPVVMQLYCGVFRQCGVDDIQKPLGTRLRNSSGAPRRILPLPPSPIFAPVLLGYAVTIGPRNSKEGQTDLRDITRNNTQSCVLRLSDSSVPRRDRRLRKRVLVESVE